MCIINIGVLIIQLLGEKNKAMMLSNPPILLQFKVIGEWNKNGLKFTLRN